MEINPFWIVTSLISLGLLVSIAWSAVRKSSFGVLLLATEYFYILGIGVFPIVLGLGLISLLRPLEGYVAVNGAVGAATYVHMLMYAIGAFSAYRWFPFRRRCARAIMRMQFKIHVNQKHAFAGLAVTSIFLSGLYVYLVGIDFAMLSVVAGRSGDFSNFGENVQFLFLKTLAQLCLVTSVVFIPGLVKRRQLSVPLFTVLFVAVCLFYLNSAARGIFVETIFVALAFLLYYQKLSPLRLILASLGVIFAGLIFAYGKVFILTLGLYLFAGAKFELVSNVAGVPFWDEFFAHFGHLLFSVDAGINHFLRSGPFLPKDVLLALIGFLPSGWFSRLGLDSLSYRFVATQFSCLNTAAFGETTCTVPPYYPGASAYLLPLAGGFIFGAMRYSMFAALETAWIEGERSSSPWLAYLLFSIASNFMLFIPDTVSLASVMLMGLLMVLYASTVFRMLSRYQPDVAAE